MKIIPIAFNFKYLLLSSFLFVSLNSEAQIFRKIKNENDGDTLPSLDCSGNYNVDFEIPILFQNLNFHPIKGNVTNFPCDLQVGLFVDDELLETISLSNLNYPSPISQDGDLLYETSILRQLYLGSGVGNICFDKNNPVSAFKVKVTTELFCKLENGELVEVDLCTDLNLFEDIIYIDDNFNCQNNFGKSFKLCCPDPEISEETQDLIIPIRSSVIDNPPSTQIEYYQGHNYVSVINNSLNDEAFVVRVFSANGAQVLRESEFYLSPNSQKEIDLNSLPVGIYFIQLAKGDGIIIKKIFKTQ